MGDFNGLEPWDETLGLAPDVSPRHGNATDIVEEMREEIRKVILEELRNMFMS
jgi:hypothetical protein